MKKYHIILMIAIIIIMTFTIANAQNFSYVKPTITKQYYMVIKTLDTSNNTIYYAFQFDNTNYKVVFNTTGIFVFTNTGTPVTNTNQEVKFSMNFMNSWGDFVTCPGTDGKFCIGDTSQTTNTYIDGNMYNWYNNSEVKFINSMPDNESSLECLQTFIPFRWPSLGMPIQYQFTVPYTAEYEYGTESCTVTGGTDNNTIATIVFTSYPEMMLNQEAGKVVGLFTVTPYYKPGNTTADKKLKITLVTPTHTFTDYEITIPTLIGYTDTNGDGVDDRDGKSQEQISVPQIEQETNNYILDKPQRSEYADGILGSVEYGFDTLLYYIEYPFVALGNLLQKLITILNQAFTWMGTFNAFLQQIFSFLPQEITACIIVAFIAGTIALIYRIFRGA